MGHLLAGDSGSVASFMNSPNGGTGPGPWAPYGSGTRTIRNGEPILIDYAGEWGGYIADQTRMLSLGPLDAFWHDAYAAMRDVASHLEGNVRPGMTIYQEEEALMAELVGHPPVEIFAETPDRFFVKVVDATLEFGPGVVASTVTLRQGGNTIEFARQP